MQVRIPPSWPVALFVLVCQFACHSPTTPTPRPPPPPPPPPPVLSLTCPANVEVQAEQDGTAILAYPSPVAQGGTAPTSVTCDPVTGASLTIGATNVTCSAQDASQQTATCTFVARVTPPPPLIAVTRFLAFGDSITEGETGISAFLATLISPLEAYPFQLDELLSTRYSDQKVEVLNRGIGGESANEGRDRLPGVLQRDRPQVLLLLEGVNGLELPSTTVESVAANLRAMVRTAIARRVEVLIATLTPISDARNNRHPEWHFREKILELNGEIGKIAREHNIGRPIDIYGAFRNDESLLSEDGLHPTGAGYALMAQTFFKEIVRRYERDTTLSLTESFPFGGVVYPGRSPGRLTNTSIGRPAKGPSSADRSRSTDAFRWLANR